MFAGDCRKFVAEFTERNDREGVARWEDLERTTLRGMDQAAYYGVRALLSPFPFTPGQVVGLVEMPEAK